MHRSAPVFALLTSAVIAVSAMGAQTVSADSPVTIRAQSLDTRPESRVEGDEAMDGAVAAAVIGAMGKQFGEQEVAVKLDEVAVDPASLRDRTVSGNGRLQIGGDLDWIPFQFSALYDTVGTTVSYPRLKIGGTGDGEEIASNSKIAVALSNKVDAALRTEFPQQPVAMLMEHVTTSAVGKRFLQVNGVGTADFGVDGTTAAQVEALYDQRNGTWVRVDYELGTTSNWADRPAKPVAAL
jgi:hypothetical protein